MGCHYYYFTGKRCNQDWEKLETPEAKVLRGHGWWNFRKAVIQERGWRCEVCGRPPDQIPGFDPRWPNRLLHLHHQVKVRKARQLRFERSNVVVCCPGCHVRVEKANGQVTDAGGLRFRAPMPTTIDPSKEAPNKPHVLPSPLSREERVL